MPRLSTPRRAAQPAPSPATRGTRGSFFRRQVRSLGRHAQAAAALLALAAWAAPPLVPEAEAQTTTEVWSTTMTVGLDSSGSTAGYIHSSDTSGPSVGGSLAADDFDIGGATYTVWQVYNTTEDNRLYFRTVTGSPAAGTELPDDDELTLQLQSSTDAADFSTYSYRLQSAGWDATNKRYYWSTGVTAHNRLPSGQTTSDTLTVKLIRTTTSGPDTTAPRVTSIVRKTPTSSPTNADSLIWSITFSENVQNVDAADFSVSGTTATVTTVTEVTASSVYDVTVSGGDLAVLDGTVTLSLASGQDIADNADNALTNTAPTGANVNTYVVDNTAPSVRSIVRQTPTSSPTNADSLTWRVTFSEDVRGSSGSIGVSRFSVSGTTATRVFTEVTASTVYDVTASGGDLAGLDATVTLVVDDVELRDIARNFTTSTTPTGTNENTWVVDNTAPTVAITGVPGMSTAPFTATFTFSEDVTGFTVDDDFAEDDIEVGNGAASAFTATTAGTVFTALITPAAAGTVTVDVAADAATDEAGNGNTAAAQATSIYTVTDPCATSVTDQVWCGAVTMNTDVSDTKGFGYIAAAHPESASFGSLSDDDFEFDGTTYTVWRVTYDTNRTEFDWTFAVATGGTLTEFPAANLNELSVRFSDFSDPTTTATAELSAATYSAGNGYRWVPLARPSGFNSWGIGDTAAVRLVRTVPPDTTAPRVMSVERQDPSSSPTNADSLTWRITFSEDVKNVDAADFAIAGTTATVTAVTVATASTVFDVTASGGNLAVLDATVTLSFASGQDIADTSDNALSNSAPTGTNDDTWVVDNTAPTVTITGVPPTSTAAFTATFTFSEAVTGFVVADITLGNATASTFSATSTTVYTALITPTANGAVTVDVAAAVALDAAGNGNPAAARASSTYTMPVPTITIAAGTTPVTEGASAAFTLTRSGGPPGNPELTVNVSVTETEDMVAAADKGAKTVTFQANSATAMLGVATVADSVDETDSVVTANPATYTVGTSSSATVTVTDDDTRGVMVSALTLDVNEGSSGTYTVVLDSEPTASVTVTPSSDNSDVTVSSALTFTTMNWSTAQMVTVTAAHDSDAVDDSATISHAVAGGDYGAVTATSVTVTVDDDETADTTAPRVASIVRGTPSSSPTNVDSLTWRVTFSEMVSNVDAADFAVSGTTATLSVSAVSGVTGAYDVTASGGNLAGVTATVTLSIAAGHGIQDAASNALTNTTPTGANDNTYVVDNTAPTVTSIVRQTPTSSPTNADSLKWRIRFTENVQNVNAADFAIAGTTATVTNVTEVTASTVYDVTASGGDLAGLDATVTLSFASGRNIADNADNALSNTTPTTSTNDDTWDVDNTAPTVTITGVPATSNAAFTATFTFSEAVTGFVVADISLGNATASSFSATSTTVYTAVITATANGEVTVDVAADAATDAAGNRNTAATQASSNYTGPLVDSIAPRVASIVRRTPSSSPTNANSLKWRITFSENVKNVNAADFAIGGTTATLTVIVATASTVYDVTASGGNLAGLNATVTLSFASGRNIADNADNALSNPVPTGTNDNTWVVDNTAPTVAITGVSATNTAAFTATFTFSEAVTGFFVGDITLGNATASNFRVTSTTVYTAVITPTANGAVTVDVAASAARDAAGNGNRAATRASSTYTVVTAPGEPASLTARAGDAQVTLIWTPPALDGGAPIERYQYRHSAGSTVASRAPWMDVPDADSDGSLADERLVTVPDLDNARQYAFEVRAVNRAHLEGRAARAVAIPVRAPLPPGPVSWSAISGRPRTASRRFSSRRISWACLPSAPAAPSCTTSNFGSLQDCPTSPCFRFPRSRSTERA